MTAPLEVRHAFLNGYCQRCGAQDHPRTTWPCAAPTAAPLEVRPALDVVEDALRAALALTALARQGGMRPIPDDTVPKGFQAALAALSALRERHAELERERDAIRERCRSAHVPLEDLLRTVMQERDHAQQVEVPGAIDRAESAESEARALREALAEAEPALAAARERGFLPGPGLLYDLVDRALASVRRALATKTGGA